MIPKKIYLNEEELKSNCMCESMVSCDTPIGDWNVEYTDLSQVWNDASEEPEHNCTIAYATKNNKIGTLKRADKSRWSWYKEKYSIVMWTYIDEILPKELID